MSQQSDNRLDNLGFTGRRIGGLAGRPAAVVYTAAAAMVLGSWIILVIMGAQSAHVFGSQAGGPGAGLLRKLPDIELSPFLHFLFAQCLSPAPIRDAGMAPLLALSAMWFVMALAMMLPSAAPLIRTYCEIADTAASRAKPVAHPLILVAGYLSVWAIAAFGFAALTTFLYAAGISNGSSALPLLPVAGSVALVAAGAYQFSSLKNSCLKKCRNPFATLFARWSSNGVRIYLLGIEQGLYCLGCCWALMLIMFAVGIMNVFWMALLAVFTLFEKLFGNRVTSFVSGGILLVWAAALLFIHY